VPVRRARRLISVALEHLFPVSVGMTVSRTDDPEHPHCSKWIT
jgi:hypothetical protein